MSGRHRLLRTEQGRLRLGWRLLGFVVMAAAIGLLIRPFTPEGLLGGAAAILLGSLAAGWWLLVLDGKGPGALGFHLSFAAVGESARGLGLGVLVGLVVVALMAALGVVVWVPEEGGTSAWLGGAVAALAFLAVPAAAEEALLRGYPLQALAEAWGPGWAVIVTSVLFGVLHLDNPSAGALSTANVAAAGVLLGVVYLRTASLWWATGVHLGWNWSHGYVADVPVSGLELLDAPLYEGVTNGPAWLGGGAFGPEGSVVTTVVVLGAAAACWWGPWPTASEAALAADPLVVPAGASGA
jgi:uncharacterized protein